MNKLLHHRPARKEKLPQHLHALLDSEIDGVVVFDTDLQVLQFNDAALQIIGFSATEIKVLGLKGVFAAAFSNSLGPGISELFQSGKQCLIREFEFYTCAGEVRYCSAGCYPIRSGLGQITGGYMLLRDHSCVRQGSIKLPETSTAQSPDLVTSLLNASLLGICGLKALRNNQNQIVDFEWLVTNTKASEFLGSSTEKLIGAKLLNQAPQHQQNGIFDAFKNTVETGQPEVREIPVRQKSQAQWFRVTSTKMNDGVMVITKDITKEKATELQLRKSELLLSDLQAIAGLGFWELNYKDEHLYVSPEMYSLLGYDNEQPINTYEDFLSIIPEADRLDLDQQMQFTTISRTPTTCEHHILCQQGQPKRFITRCQVLTDATGKPLKLVGVSMDTTEMMQIKGELESIKHIEKLSQAIPFMVWTANAAGSPDFVNREWERYTGRSAANLPVCLWYEFLHDDDKAPYLEKWFGSVGSGQEFEIEFRLRNAAGEFKWHLARAVPYTSDSGEIQKWYGVVCNIDDQKNALQMLQTVHSLQQEHNHQLSKANLTLRKTNAQLDTLIYKATSELKNPVSKIQELMPKITRYIPDNNPEAETILNQVQATLDGFRGTLAEMSEARILDATLSGQEDRLHLPELLEELIEDMGMVLTQYQASVTYSLEVLQVQFPRKSMRSILFNLICNALTNSNTSQSPEVQIHSTVNPENNQIVVTVKYNGLGAGVLQTAKLPGIQPNISDADSGRGLYLVQRLIENAGGFFRVESIPENGTVYHICLGQQLAT